MTEPRAVQRAAMAAAGLAAVLAVLTVLVATTYQPLLSFDDRVVDSWHGAVEGTGWHRVFVVIAALSQPVLVIAVLLVIGVVLAVRGQRRTAIWVVTATLVTRVAATIGKLAVNRERPDIEHQIGGYSFPSGHASLIGCAMAVLLMLTLYGTQRGAVRRVLVLTWLSIALIVGLDRIFLGAHNPSDVVAGWCLGASVTLGCAAFLRIGSSVPEATPEPLAAPLPPEDRQVLGVVLNPIKIDDAETFKARVQGAARAAGWDDPLWFETTIDDAGGSMARAAIAAGADVVAVAGGDGTVRVVCSEMAGTGLPLGVIPAGTGNLLARNLGIPLLRDQAVETVLRGQDRAIDAVRISGDGLDPTRFVVMAGLGLDAAIMAGAPDALKARIGWPAYVVAGARHLRDPAVRVDITVDGGETIRRRVRTVLVGNVGFLQGGIPLLPDARLDDGVLDVVVIAPRQLFGWVPLALRVIARRRRTDESLDRFTGKSVTLTTTHPTPRQLDGDLVGAGTSLHAEIEAGTLLIRVPR